MSDDLGRNCFWPILRPCIRTLPGTPSNNGKFKGKIHSITGHEGPKLESMYSFTLSFTLALDGVGGQRHAPAALPPGEIRYPLYRRLGEPQGWSGGCGKLPPTGIRSPARAVRSGSLYRLRYPGQLVK